jgi:hypothetical protein
MMFPHPFDPGISGVSENQKVPCSERRKRDALKKWHCATFCCRLNFQYQPSHIREAWCGSLIFESSTLPVGPEHWDDNDSKVHITFLK